MEKRAKIQLEENGYAVFRGLLNPSTDLEPREISFSGLIDELAEIYTERKGFRMPANYKQMTFCRQAALLFNRNMQRQGVTSS